MRGDHGDTKSARSLESYGWLCLSTHSRGEINLSVVGGNVGINKRLYQVSK